MSEYKKEARASRKSKMSKIGAKGRDGGSFNDVDPYDGVPYIDSGNAGQMPVGRQMRKRGGKVVQAEGESCGVNLGKAPRKAGGGMMSPNPMQRKKIVAALAMRKKREGLPFTPPKPLSSGPSGVPGIGALGRKAGGVAKWEGSAKDEAQDKKLAKKHGMSMKEWESSKMDKKHDTQKSMKGLKRGGRPHKDDGGPVYKDERGVVIGPREYQQMKNPRFPYNQGTMVPDGQGGTKYQRPSQLEGAKNVARFFGNMPERSFAAISDDAEKMGRDLKRGLSKAGDYISQKASDLAQWENRGYKKGGKAKKQHGGRAYQSGGTPTPPPRPAPARPAPRPAPPRREDADTHSGNANEMTGSQYRRDLEGRTTQKKGGRIERATGGRTKAKGKTTVTINIGQPQPGAMPPGPMLPPGPPMMPPGMPPMPPGGAPMLPPAGAGPGLGAMGAMNPGGPGMTPPIPPMRKEGGRVKKIYQNTEYGSGSGLGRLEKTKWPPAK